MQLPMPIVRWLGHAAAHAQCVLKVSSFDDYDYTRDVHTGEKP